MNGNTDFAKILDEIDRRLYRAEQTLTSPAVMGGAQTNEFNEIFIGAGNEIHLSVVPPDTPGAASVNTGTFYSSSYADVSWSAPVAGVPAVRYNVELARKVLGVYEFAQIVSTSGENIRFEDLDPGVLYGVRVQAVSAVGRTSGYTAWVDFNAEVDSTTPDAPASIDVYRGATSVVVKYPASTAPDVINNKGFYEVQVDTTTSFNSGNLRTNRTSALIVSFSDILTQTTWYARVRAIDASGNVSAWRTSTGITAGNVIDSMIVSGLDAAKITFGSMSGDRITANTLDVNAIKTSTLTAKTITIGAGGQFKIGTPPTDGIFINDLGIRAYKASAQTFSLDVDGTAVFSGTVNAATIIGSSVDGGSIRGSDINTFILKTSFEYLDPTDIEGVEIGSYFGSTAIISFVHDTAAARTNAGIAFSVQDVGRATGGLALKSGRKNSAASNSESAIYINDGVSTDSSGDPAWAIILDPGAGVSQGVLLDGKAKINGALDVLSDVLIDGDLRAYGKLTISDGLLADGAAIYGATTVYAGSLRVDSGNIFQTGYFNGVDPTYGDIAWINYPVGGLPYVRFYATYSRTTGSAANLNVDSSGYIRRSTSSMRYKRDVRKVDLTQSIEGLLSLDAKIFKEKNDKIVNVPDSGEGPAWTEPNDQDLVGYIAEEVAEAMGDEANLFVINDEEGRPDEIIYGRLIILAVEEIKRLRSRIETIERNN